MTTKLPKPPAHLRPATRAYWTITLADYEMEPWQLRIFQAACEAWDRKESAREVAAKDGPFYINKYGEPRPHPALAVARDAEISHARLMRELGLGDAQPPDAPRPPRVGAGHAS